MNPEKVLKQTFGYDSFRPGQKRVIDLVFNRQNVLAVMPNFCSSIKSCLYLRIIIKVFQVRKKEKH